jgi:hypothetical protein
MKFSDLPPEVLSRILALADDVDEEIPPGPSAGRTIVIVFTQKPIYRPSRPGDTYAGRPAKRAHVHYNYSLVSAAGHHGPAPPDTTNRTTYNEYLRRNPNVLQLNSGQIIRFNATRDTIFMDMLSLFCLGSYLETHSLKSRQRFLKGFGSIRNLATPLLYIKGKEGFDGAGAWALRQKDSFALTGVTDANHTTLTNIRDAYECTEDVANELDSIMDRCLTSRPWRRRQWIILLIEQLRYYHCVREFFSDIR